VVCEQLILHSSGDNPVSDEYLITMGAIISQ
jgi:hypothetical protein